MVLVDTSVLIDYFKGIDNERTNKFQFIQDQNIEFGIANLIYLEILQGSKNAEEYNKLKKYLETQLFYGLKNDKSSYEKSATIFMLCRKKGITIRSTIDLIISQIAIENNLYLLHNDKDFDEISKIQKELKIY